MSIDSKPTCPIISRFAEDLKLNAKSPRTVQSYCRALRKFTEYLRHTPDQATKISYASICSTWLIKSLGREHGQRHATGPQDLLSHYLSARLELTQVGPRPGRAEFAGGSLDR